MNSIPSGFKAQPLSKIRSFLLVCTDYFFNILKLFYFRVFKLKRRSEEVVAKEYDQNNWKRYLTHPEWKKFSTLKEFLLGDDERMRISLVEGKVVKIENKEYYRYRAHILQNCFRKYVKNFDEVYEIGSGIGFNLFTLHESKQFKKLHGLEISENGIEVSKNIASHFNLGDISFNKIDLTLAGDPNFKLLKNKFVFSYYCLEQLNRDLSSVIDNIIMARPAQVMHIEPVPLKNSFLELNSYIYSVARDYSRNLLKELEKRERKGLINILGVEKLYYAPTIRHFPKLILWEPRS